jgi:hypothetical protein
MFWIVVIPIVFICAFLLIARLYTGKDKKPTETSQKADESSGHIADAETDE